MRTAGIAFAAGLGGALSGWLVAASMGAAQMNDDANADAPNPDQTADGSDAGGAGEPQSPQLTLKAEALVEGPASRIVYVEAGETIITEQPDMFAWVYPEWVLAGPLGDEEVTVIPREQVVGIRMTDVSASARQVYREQAQRLDRESPPGDADNEAGDR